MHAVAVDHIERLGIADWPAASGAQITRNSVAVRQVPTVLDLAPGEPLGLGASIAAVEVADGGTLLEKLAPVNLRVGPFLT